VKTLVLFHGWGTDGRIWPRQKEAWEGRLPVLTPDLARWEPAWVADYLRALPLKETVVVGWSLGGMLLLEALPQLPVSPAALVLVGAAVSFCRRQDYPWGQPPAAVRAMRRTLKEDPEKVLRQFALSCLAPGEEAFREQAAALFKPAIKAAQLATGLDYLLNLDLRERLRPCTGPTAIIQGEADGIVDRAQGEYLHRQLPGSRLHVLRGAGHLPFFTRAEEFNEILAEMMGE
jgi:pimeloyl-[acyl-carrier protein] methyl ester esterase